MNTLILGSASPRRREILASLGLGFVVHAADIDESVQAAEAPDAYLERVTLAKLDAVRASAPRDLTARANAFLVADTSVVLGEAILGKPAGDAEARAMITRLAGVTHEVLTRFVIARVHEATFSHAETVRTRVTFRSLDDGEIDAYVATGEGRDKAGGYAVQGRAGGFVSRIDGSYSCVVGLPACEVVVALRRLGLV